MLPPGPARLLYRPTVGGHKDYDRLYPLFPFPWAFITAGRLPASRWLWAPPPPTTGALPHFSKPPCWVSACACVRVSGLRPITCDSGRPSSYAFP